MISIDLLVELLAHSHEVDFVLGVRGSHVCLLEVGCHGFVVGEQL